METQERKEIIKLLRNFIEYSKKTESKGELTFDDLLQVIGLEIRLYKKKEQLNKIIETDEEAKEWLLKIEIAIRMLRKFVLALLKENNLL